MGEDIPGPIVEDDDDAISTSSTLRDEKEASWQPTWQRYRGMSFVLLSEMFGACMIATARMLQNGTEERPGMSLPQILFIRFSITLIFSTLYMWYTQVSDFPWGAKEVRGLLVLRGCAGFVGVFGFYYSVKYLPLSEAIVISFMTPLLTAWACSLVIHTPFTRRQLIAGFISLSGIILIAQPSSLFSMGAGDAEEASPVDPNLPTEVTTLQRLSSIGLGMIANVGGACAYTIIRLIGSRAHALISVNYYGILATIISFLSILFIPSLSFQLPRDLREWLLILSLGIFGFLLQFLMTKGLQLDKTGTATNMMYSQIVFAIALDWSIWGVLPGWWSWVGGAIVVASTIWVAVQKVEEVPRKLGGVESDVEYGLVPLEENEQEREGDNDDDFLANSVGKAEEEEEANTNREKRGVESSASI